MHTEMIFHKIRHFKNVLTRIDTDRLMNPSVFVSEQPRYCGYWHTVLFSIGFIDQYWLSNQAFPSDMQFVEMETKQSTKCSVVYSLQRLSLVKASFCLLALYVY